MDNNSSKPLYIITGATDAMGSVITQQLAEAGHPIVMACFDTAKSEAKAQELAIRTRNKDITSIYLDLGSFASVRTFVKQIKEMNRPVAVLVNNASYISHRSEISPDGYEKLVQVNFLSTALLSILIQPLMVEGGRIIFSTSLSSSPVSIPYEFPAVSNFMPIAAYAQSKLALSLFSIYLSTVLRNHRISVNSVDPGLVNLSKLGMNRFFSRFSFISNHTGNLESGAKAMMRAIGSADTGFIFKSGNKQIKASTLLRNREVFIKLCNDTMRVLNKQLKDPEEA
ncbi:MAG: SDR family NAD(P)-dependent oxidoreductase [Bacteroidales bacterium]|nr:SDR family NAD(P)-dependent oxidoreductase [Bacteroidales bacterium]